LIEHIAGLIWRGWDWVKEMLQGRNEYLPSYLGNGMNRKME